MAGLKKAGVICFYMKICIYDWELCAFFKEEELTDAVIRFAVSDCNYARGDPIHNLNRRNSVILGIYYRASEHISGNGIDNILFLTPNLAYIPGKHGNTADKLFVGSIRKKISVKVV